MPVSNESSLRDAILGAARRLIGREGYRDVSIRRIARAARCSVSTIYLYFENKDALIHALIYEGFERWHRETLAIVERPAPPIERLEALCRRYVEFGLENPEWYEVMYLFRPERIARYPKELYRRTRRPMELAAALVAESAPDRYRNAEEARVATHVAWALLHGVVSTILAQRLDSRIPRSEYVEAAIAQAVRVVGPER